MPDIKVYYEGNGKVALRYLGKEYVYEGGGRLLAANETLTGLTSRIKITDTEENVDIFKGLLSSDIKDRSGTVLGANQSATVTALNAIFDKKVLDDFIVKDETTALTGTTKIRHKAGTGQTEDRDEGGTLELDTHAASIGLYGSFLKITESDLGNTTGKNAAFGRLQFFLENQGTAYEILDVLMGSQTSNPSWDVNSDTTTWYAPNGYTLTGLYSLKGNSSDVAEMRFYDTDSSHYIALKTGVINSNQTFLLPQVDGVNNQVLKTNGSGQMFFGSVDYTQVTNTPTIPTATSDLTNDSGFITGANELDGQLLEVFTRTSAYGNGAYEGTVIKYGSGTLQANKVFVYTSSGWVATDADFESKTKGLFGLALGSSATSDGLLVKGIHGHTGWSGFSAGDTLYIDLAEGAITNSLTSHTTGDFVRVIGYALGSNYIYIDPSPDYIELS